MKQPSCQVEPAYSSFLVPTITEEWKQSRSHRQKKNDGKNDSKSAKLASFTRLYRIVKIILVFFCGFIKIGNKTVELHEDI